MDLQTFKASTMAEALSLVKTTMGHDAIILHTRTFQKRQWLGIKRREMVEITAGRGLPKRRASVSGKLSDSAPAGPMSALTRTTSPASVYGAQSLLQTRTQPVASSTDRTRHLLETPAAGSAMMLGLSQEVGELTRIVKSLVNETRAAQAPQVPEELFDHYLQLIQNQVADELARDIVKSLHRDIRPEYLAQAKYVKDRLVDHIEKLITVAGPIKRTKTVGPHIVALIGPTGVGKTTTLAKLAANLKLREKRRVGLITLDTYRIAAVDQLKRYADIIGSPLRVVSNVEELRDAVASMADLDFILIDTAGRSPNDTLKLNELRGFLAAIQPDEVHLVLSSTASQCCVELAVARFSEVRVDKIIFTKLDEAASVGLVLNVIKKLNKSLSYVTTGQDVPDDIEVGRGRRLAQMIVGESP